MPDLVAANDRLGRPQGHEHVVPPWVGRLGDIGGRRIGLGVGVRVEDPNNAQPTLFCVTIRSQVTLRVNGVDEG